MKKFNIIKNSVLSALSVLLLLPAPKVNAAWIAGFGNQRSDNYDLKVDDMARNVFLGSWALGLLTGSPIFLFTMLLDEKGNISNSQIEKALVQKHAFLSNDREALGSLATLVSKKATQATLTLSVANPQVKIALTKEEILKSVEIANFTDEQVNLLLNDLM